MKVDNFKSFFISSDDHEPSQGGGWMHGLEKMQLERDHNTT
jgi:hypothetical protein